MYLCDGFLSFLAAQVPGINSIEIIKYSMNLAHMQTTHIFQPSSVQNALSHAWALAADKFAPAWSECKENEQKKSRKSNLF
jgi:hypothetical protein